MARVVLTNQLENQIKDKLRMKYEGPRDKLLKDFLEKHKEMLYETVVPKEIQDRLATIPHNLLQMNKSMCFILDGEACEIPFTSNRPLPDVYHSYYSRMKLELPLSIAEEFNEIKAQRERLKKECSDLITEITKVFASCTTLKQLLEIWPSALEFCPADVVERHNRVAAPRTKEEVDVKLSDSTKLALVKIRMT